MLKMAEVPVKPGVFKCPEDFESREYLESDTSIDSEDDDYDLVLISAPNDLEFALLDGEELPIRGVEHLRLNKENGIENLRVESLKTDKSSNLTLLLPQKGKIVPAKKFTHYVSITKDIEVPSISFPPSSRNVQELPDGLKQRYTAFGADDPIVTVGEKDVIKRKKKSSKREKAFDDQETVQKSKVTKEKPMKSSREDDDDTVSQVETKKKVSRRIKKAKTSSDEEIPIQIEKPLKKVSRKKKESNLEESTNASSSDSVGKLSSKEKMKLTAEYINQLDTEIVSASPSTSSKKKTSNVPVLEADAAEKKIRKPKKSSSVETKSKKEKKTSKRNKDDDDEDENRRKAKEDLINEIMYSKSPKSRVRKLKTDSHIASFSQEY